MEKSVTITNITATFKKDLDTFGKMDPFLSFSIGQETATTEVAEGGGKNPNWKAVIKLTFLQEKEVMVKAWEKDTGSEEEIGQGRIDVSELKEKGEMKCEIVLDGEEMGKVEFAYQMAVLPPSPLLLLQNCVCSFLSRPDFILKTKPFLSVGQQKNSADTEPIQNPNLKKLSWPGQLRVKLQKSNSLPFQILDEENEKKVLLHYECLIEQFTAGKGKKKIYLVNNSAEPLGQLTFDYETMNFPVAKGAQQQKMEEGLHVIRINRIKGKMKEGGEDIYFKISLGPNLQKTQYIQNAKKDFQMKINKCFYSQDSFAKLYFAAYDKDLMADDLLALGSLQLPIINGEQIVKLASPSGQDMGSIIVSVEQTNVQKKTIILSDICLKVGVSADILGSNEPFVMGKVGGWSSRTQTSNGKSCSFDKAITLHFDEETVMRLQVWDEDLTKHDKLFEKQIPISDFSGSGEMNIVLDTKSEVSFKYQGINVKKSAVQSKPITERSKQQTKRSQQPKQEKKQQVNEPIDQAHSQEREKTESVRKQQKNGQQVDVSNAERTYMNSVKNSIRLPSIGYSKNYGDKIFDKQSTATLQKSILVYSMPKAPRFANDPKYNGQISYYVGTCFKPNASKGVGFGFGSKRQFPEWMERNMKENPPPGAYFDHHSSTSTEFRPKGPTFGIAHRYYEKVTIPKEKKMMSASKRLSPISFR